MLEGASSFLSLRHQTLSVERKMSFTILMMLCLGCYSYCINWIKIAIGFVTEIAIFSVFDTKTVVM